MQVRSHIAENCGQQLFLLAVGEESTKRQWDSLFLIHAHTDRFLKRDLPRCAFNDRGLL